MRALIGGTRKTRQMKAICSCGYMARISRKWLIELGAPLCPRPECEAAVMALPEWDPIEQWQESGEAESISDHVINDKWVVSRTWHVCESCGADQQPGEHLRSRSYTVSGEFTSDYTCQACNAGGADAHRAHAAEQNSTDAFGREARG